MGNVSLAIYTRLTNMQVYAPTDDSKSKAKGKFCGEFQRGIDEVGRRETLIVMGDLNARGGRHIYNNWSSSKSGGGNEKGSNGEKRIAEENKNESI